MFTRSSIVWQQKFASAPRALGAAVIALGLALIMAMSMAWPSQAAARSFEAAAGSTAIIQPLARPTMKAPAQPAIASIGYDAVTGLKGGSCCGGAAHPHGVPCTSGACAGCALAVPLATSGLVPEVGSGIHAFPAQAGSAQTRPSALFRPPLLFL